MATCRGGALQQVHQLLQGIIPADVFDIPARGAGTRLLIQRQEKRADAIVQIAENQQLRFSQGILQKFDGETQ